MSTAFLPSREAQACQCAAVLSALQVGPQSTAALRALLGVSSCPAARVLTLRKAGQRIKTLRQGRQALYVLQDGCLS